MKSVYLPWTDSNDSSLARISPVLPDDLEEISWMFNGKDLSLKDAFPENVVLDLQEDRGLKLSDFIPNSHHSLIVSEKLKSILETSDSSFEFYKISIRNLKKRIEKKPYYLAHLLDSVECLDLDESDVRWSSLDSSQAARITKLVLDKSRIPEDKQIFRLAEMKGLVMVRKDLAFKIYREEECRGMLFKKVELFGEEFRD